MPTEHPSIGPITGADVQMRWVEEVVAAGVRRPGSAADLAVEEWAEAMFRRLGLEDVHREPVSPPARSSPHSPGPPRPDLAPSECFALSECFRRGSPAPDTRMAGNTRVSHHQRGVPGSTRPDS